MKKFIVAISLILFTFQSGTAMALNFDNVSTQLEPSTTLLGTQTQQIASSEGFTIMPAIENTIKPRMFILETRQGQPAEELALIKNLSGKPVTFALYAAEETKSSSGSIAYKTREQSASGAATWIKFATPEITLQPLESKIVSFKVLPPEGTPNGEYKFGIAMEKSSKTPNNQGITIATRVIINGKVTISDNPKGVPHKDPSAGMIQGGSGYGWKTYYFWFSLIAFIITGGLFIWSIYNEHLKKERTTTIASLTRPSSRPPSREPTTKHQKKTRR